MKRQLRNLGSLLVSDAGSRLIGFFVTAYLARLLGPSGFGVLSIGLAVLGHLAILGSPGMQVVEARNVAARLDGEQDRVGNVLVVRLALSAVLFAVMWLVSGALDLSQPIRDVVRLYALALIPYALMLDWFFQGKEDFFRVGLSRFVIYVVYGFCVFAFVRGADNLLMAPVSFVLGNSIAAALLIIFYWARTRRLPVSLSRALWPAIIRENLPVGLALLLAQIVSNLPPIVVGCFLAERDVGMYSAALKLIFVFLLLDRMLNALFLPVVTRYFATRRDDIPFLLGTTLKGLVILALPIAVCGVLVAPAAMVLVYGAGYADAIPLLRVMMGFVFLTMVNSIFVCILVGSGHERLYMRSMVKGTGVMVVTLIALTYIGGTPGASWALLIGEGMTLGFMIRSSRVVTPLPSARMIIRPLVGCAVMLAVYLMLVPISMVLASVGGLVVYVVVTVALSSLSREEFRFLRERFV